MSKLIKLLFFIAYFMILSCASQHNIVTVKKENVRNIEKWRKNGVQIIEIDTVNPIIGETYYKVRFR